MAMVMTMMTPSKIEDDKNDDEDSNDEGEDGSNGNKKAGKDKKRDEGGN
jgi:hypothetical protein